MNLLFLFPYPLEQAPSQRFRFEQYLGVLFDEKHFVYTQSFWGPYYWKVLYQQGHFLSKWIGVLRGFGRRFRMLLSLHRYDVVFIHREVTPIGPPIFEWLIAKMFRKRIIFDFDDAIWLPNTSENNKLSAWLKWHSKTATICQLAWKVSAGNNYLANYALKFNSNVVINPTTIDTNYHEKKEKSNEGVPIIGWTGSHSTLPYLDLLWPALEELAKDADFVFRVVANQAPGVTYPWLEFIPWSRETEIEVLNSFDIGVMPLPDNEWSRGKCGFKALQYMAMGIPTLASPVGVNISILEHGVNGYLCQNTNEWIAYLKILLEDSSLKKDIGKMGKHTIETSYSVGANTSNFLNLFIE